MNKIFTPQHVEGDVWKIEIEMGVLVKELDDMLRAHDPPLALPSNVVLDSVSSKKTMSFCAMVGSDCLMY